MSAMPDNYDGYYADKLWNLLPAVYRTEDADQLGTQGPLRELVNRIGAQAAVVRRSIDRMWEDQSIETCDDWVIPYIGALLDTNLVPGLDARGQRIDVARTIYYRQRKGTVGILEEVAANITGWDAKVVEFFRRMGRTRHLLDPSIGQSLDPGGAAGSLQVAEGLSGALTYTGVGGFADLRNVYGALKAGSAFDEFFHTADIRAGVGAFGWYNISHIGVFLWRLKSYPVGPVTPVPIAACPGWFTFDPTGRDIPLFAAPRTAVDYGNNWVSPVEAQLPTPISRALLLARGSDASGRTVLLYPGALAVYGRILNPLDDFLIAFDALSIWPERGRFAPLGSPPSAFDEWVAEYRYGFPSDIGAGPFDRRIGTLVSPTSSPSSSVTNGGNALATSIPTSGVLQIGDSLTYAGAANATVDGDLTLEAANEQRPLIRFPAGKGEWILGGAAGASLTLDGLFISGADVVLRGQFDAVTISCCTFDPGTAAAEPPPETGPGAPYVGPYGMAADGVPLVPSRLWVEGTVTTMTVDRSVMAAIRTRNGGLIEALNVSNSTLQAIPTSDTPLFTASDIKDPLRLLTRLLEAGQPGSLDTVANALVSSGPSGPIELHQSPLTTTALVDFLNAQVDGRSLESLVAGAGVPLSAATLRLIAAGAGAAATPALNHALLEDAFPRELADAAIAIGDGVLSVSRCTVLGRVLVHQLQASESILWDLTLVDDAQAGCVRFTAWAQGSVLPRRFESVSVPLQAPLFTSIEFGKPGYVQLAATADLSILPGSTTSATPQNTISAGAADGSEMGAFARDKNPAKLRGLLLKFQEFLPAGLIPVVINVT